VIHPLHHPVSHSLTLYNGCKISYTDEGDGPQTILFVHGLGAYNRTWIKNTEILQSHCRCIAIDLPGNGHSSTGDYPYTMEFFAHCLIDFIGRMKLQNVILAGHSMGGQIVLTAAIMEPSCCERIILFSPAGFETFSAHERMMYEASLKYLSMLTSNRQAIQHLIHTSFYQFPKDAERLESELIRIMEHQPGQHYKTMTDRCIAAMLAEPVFKKLHTIKQPTLIFFGEKDALIPNTLLHPGTTLRVAETGKKEFKHAKLVILKNCGHFVQWEKASLVNAAIQTWIQEALPVS